MNSFKNFIRNTEFEIRRPYKNQTAFNIEHVPTKGYVTLINYPTRIVITEGETPRKARGKGVGTKLRALATLYAIMKGVPIYQNGANLEGRSNVRHAQKGTPKIPTSTYILRYRLGWKNNGGTKSKFEPGKNNNKKVRNVLA
jgi:hypothetical protein